MNKVFSDQSDWDEMLDFIAEKKLTPVLGKEMYTFKDGDQVIPLDKYLSKQLLDQQKITDFQAASLPEVVDYLEIEKGVKTMDILRKLKSIVKDIDLDLPVLTEFLSIEDLNFFINTAVYNNILETKIFKSRRQQANSTNFSINEAFSDCPNIDRLTEPFVFNAFGSLLNTNDPAVSEEDLLEYTGSFKEKMSNATNIVNALKNKNLLFLGCTFPDWMVRFALRLLSNEPLHEWGSKRTIIVVNDPSDLRQDQNHFLKNYDVVTYEGSTAEFVHELSTRWKKRNPGKTKSIFLSYARADMQAVENLKKGIEQIGNITCWFDKSDLVLGDDWEEKIIVSIRKADVFMPLISQKSLEHKDGYVQKEWYQGRVESKWRDSNKDDNNYLIPVVIDDTKLYGDQISKHFDSKINIAKAPMGNPDEKFITDIKKILNLA